MASFSQTKDMAEKVKIIVNRAGLDNGHISLKKAKDTIGREIFWQLPNDFRTVIEARNNGIPLIEQAPKASVTQSLLALAEALTARGKPDQRESARKAGGLGRFFGLSRA